MGKDTAIQWCDHTFSGWRGCRKVAPECENCYIVTTSPFRVSGQKHGSQRVRASDDYWKQPLKWNKIPAAMVCPECGDEHVAPRWDVLAADDARKPPMRCMRAGCYGIVIPRRPRVFSLSLGDWLDDEVPIEWFADFLRVIACTQNLDYLLLTKRPQNWEPRLRAAAVYLQTCQEGHINDPAWLLVHRWLWSWKQPPGEVPTNIWIGVSAGADQAAALAIPAEVHFLSCEPMLHPLDTTHAARFNQIIFGGESGSKARPCNVQWIRDGVQFCREHGVKPYVKQLGKSPIAQLGVDYNRTEHNGNLLYSYERSLPIRLEKLRAIDEPVCFQFKHSHGGDPSEWPEDLRVREFPESAQ